MGFLFFILHSWGNSLKFQCSNQDSFNYCSSLKNTQVNGYGPGLNFTLFYLFLLYILILFHLHFDCHWFRGTWSQIWIGSWIYFKSVVCIHLIKWNNYTMLCHKLEGIKWDNLMKILYEVQTPWNMPFRYFYIKTLSRKL